jgi:hypothetical protein
MSHPDVIEVMSPVVLTEYLDRLSLNDLAPLTDAELFKFEALLVHWASLADRVITQRTAGRKEEETE